MTPDPPTTGVDGPPPAVDVPPRGGFLGFLGTIPGILTAVAAVITALGTVYGIHLAAGSSGSTLTEPPQTAPQPVPTSVDTSSVAAQADSAPVADDVLGDEATALLASCAEGFLEDCAGLLDLLAVNCQLGSAPHCDGLYYITPVGSDYEAYGATCGGRFGWEYAGRCSEL